MNWKPRYSDVIKKVIQEIDAETCVEDGLTSNQVLSVDVGAESVV
jgi:hypothetical protein